MVDKASKDSSLIIGDDAVGVVQLASSALPCKAHTHKHALTHTHTHTHTFFLSLALSLSLQGAITVITFPQFFQSSEVFREIARFGSSA